MSYVKFMLAQLNRENGGFAFESLARDLVHAEYCRNIVPATGPVGRGDRGEDARTHENYILDSDDALHLYEGLAPRSNERIIFAFSIREDWEAKLDADVDKILKNDLQPDKIVFASNQFISTRTRQDKESSLRDELKCGFEILDGFWFLQHLETNHYDLAVKYLGCEQKVDARLDEMYRRVLGFAHDTLSDEDRREVERLESEVRYRSAYVRREHLVLDLQRLADTFVQYSEHLEDALTWYEEALGEARSEQIEPRIVLDVYYVYFKALFKFPSRQREIFTHLPTYRGIVFDANYRSYFAKVNVWQLYLSWLMRDDPEFRQFARESYSYFVNYDRAGHSPLTQALLLEAEIDSQLVLNICEDRFDFNHYLDKLNELLGLVENAQFYDVGVLAEKIAVMSPVLSGNERYEVLYERVESIAAHSLSDFERGSVRRTRALAHYESGDYVRAVQHLGKAKYLWRDYDSLRGKLLAALIMGQCYQRLEQYYAGEWELLQGIYVGTLIEDSLQLDLVYKAFGELHSIALAAGRLLTSIAFADLYFRARSRWGTAAEVDDEFADLFEQNMMVVLSRLFMTNRPLHDYAMRMLRDMRPVNLSLYAELVSKSREELEAEHAGTPEYDTVMELYTWLRRGARGSLDLPIVDELQAYQLMSFKSGGIDFEVFFRKKHKPRIVAESIAANLQSFFTNASDHLTRLDWLEDHVRLHIHYSELGSRQSLSGACYGLSQKPNSELLEMEVTIFHDTYQACVTPPFEGYLELMFGLWMEIVDLCTLNPPSEIEELAKEISASGLLEQFTDCPPYGVLFERFLGTDFLFDAEQDK